MRLTRRGFTLVEIMIVVAIVGILAAIAIPNFANARKIAEKATCRTNARQLQSALDTYASSPGNDAAIKGKLQEEIMGIVCPNYLRTMPTCPNPNGRYVTDLDGNVMCSVHSIFVSDITPIVITSEVAP